MKFFMVKINPPTVLFFMEVEGGMVAMHSCLFCHTKNQMSRIIMLILIC